VNFIDFIIIFFILILCIRGYLKGFVNELFSLCILGVGLALAFYLYRPLGETFLQFIENTELALISAFFFVFILVTILFIIIRNIIAQFVERMNLTDIDSFLGLLVGLLKGLLVAGLVLIFLRNHPVLRLDEAIDRSLLYVYLERILRAFFLLLPERVVIPVYRFLGIVV
jgi:membrane protein required for colicin V production